MTETTEPKGSHYLFAVFVTEVSLRNELSVGFGACDDWAAVESERPVWAVHVGYGAGVRPKGCVRFLRIACNKGVEARRQLKGGA